MRRNHTLILLFLLLLPASILGQDPYYISLNRSAGLPSNTVYDIIQDRKGFIWTASEEGISRYDGFEFKTFYAPSQSSSAGSSLYEDYLGRIWYENFDGNVYYVENETLKQLDIGKPMGFIPFGVINKTLYKASYNGIKVYSLETLQLTETIPLESSEYGNTAFSNTEFYIMVKNKLCVVDERSELKFINYPSGDLGEDFKIFSNDSATILVSKLNTKRLAYTYNGNSIEKLFELKEPAFIQNINYFENKYWVSTAKGLYVYDENGKVHNGGLAFFNKSNISKIIIDRQKNYWISTIDNGLMLIPEWSTRIKQSPIYQFTRITKQKDGFYLGTKNGEIIRTDFELSSFETKFKSKKKFPVEFLYHDASQNFLYLDAKERYLGSIERMNLFEFLSLKSLSKVDEKYHAYASSGHIGLLRLNSNVKSKWDILFEQGVLPFNPNLSEIKNKIRGKAVSFSEKKQQIFYATNIGLFATDTIGTKEILFNEKSILAYNLCTAGEYLYILTNQKNLIRLNPDYSISKLNSFFELGESSIKWIKLIDNILYLITNDAIIEVFVEDPRLPYRTINLKINQLEIQDIETSNGTVYLIVDGSIIMVNKNQKSNEKNNPIFNLNKLKVNGNQIDHTKQHILKHNQNNIEINFSVLNFGSANEPTNYYKINNQEWKLISKETRTLNFPALNPGDYEIAFRIGNEQNGKYINEKIRFIIEKPFWYRWWFILIIALLIFFLIVFYYSKKTSALIKKNALMREKMQVEQALSKSVLTAIKAQMNPHFFYNALNTVQAFIYADNKKSAGNYLAKFSKLTRMILEMSEKDNIYLNEEIHALSLYLELEKMRFSEDFNYTITVAENIEPELIKFPPMIIQPYVENALKHGLLHKNGQKNLTIHFDLVGNDLIVKVEDNGIGRNKSEEINEKRNQKHNSFSVKANNTRLEILNRGLKHKVGTQYIDNVNELGVPSGTTVIITIPNQI